MKRLIFLLLTVWLLTFQVAAAQSRNFDVNCDGEVNIADVNAIIHAIYSDFGDSRTDVNCDGEVNIADVNSLVDVILGREPQNNGLVFHVGNASFKMIKVDGGTFMMGNNSGKSNEKPVHEVTLSPY